MKYLIMLLISGLLISCLPEPSCIVDCIGGCTPEQEKLVCEEMKE